MRNRCLAAILLLLSAGPNPALLEAAEEFPGNPARIAYETGLISYLRGRQDRASEHFRKALDAGGPYGDLARMMLVRLSAHRKAPKTLPDASLRSLLSGFEDERLLPLAWFAMIQALLESGRDEEALHQGLEFSLRFPEHELADDALLVAIHILYNQRSYEAALDLVYRVEQLGNKIPDRLPEVELYKAKIYLSPGRHHSPLRACRALRSAAASQRNGPTRDHRAQELYRLYCASF